MQKLLLRLWAHFRPTILFITHKLEEVMHVADRITVIRDGHYIAPTVPGAGTEMLPASLVAHTFSVVLT